MKKVIFISTVVFALAIGLAYADESYPVADHQMSGAVYNGITYFDIGPEPACLSESGAGAGGLGAEEPSPSVDNGITVIESRPAGLGAKGSCAGGLGTEEPGMKVNNGITLFEF